MANGNGAEIRGEGAHMPEVRRSHVHLIGLRDVQDLVRGRLSASVSNILITGESGTGKEIVARYLHEHSPRGGRTFMAINCGAIPHELVESELFGHVRGAFTGADVAKEGLFEAARGGTVFLDEVAEMAVDVQAKL